MVVRKILLPPNNSRRFLGLVLIAILGVLEVEGILSAEVVVPLIKLISGFIVIRTVDRAGEKIGGK